MSAIFEPKSETQALILERSQQVQILVIGGAAGSGKSYLLQGIPLFFADDPRSECIMFRRTTPQVVGQGGIWDTANSIYSKLPKKHKPRTTSQPKQFIFPDPTNPKNKEGGMRVRFSHMQYEKDKEDIQGLQFTFIGVDEGCQFEWSQLEYMMSRLRSESKYFSRMVISCNPDPDHKLKEMISWYLDDKGYPIKERSGAIRYFILRNGDFVWADSKEELEEIYGENCRPKSFSFVPATIYDNPVMMETNPDYLSWLEGLEPVLRAQLLDGNWEARGDIANMVKRESFVEVNSDDIPNNITWARGWDLASEAVTATKKDADFSTGIKLGKDREGYFYLAGNYCDSNYDEHLDEYGRFRKRVHERDKVILEQANWDGLDTVVVLPVDPGAAGKAAFQEMAKRFISEGVRVKQDPMPVNKDKRTKFTPFSDAVEAGLVRIVKDTFSLKEYESLMREYERFTGERSKRAEDKKDDRCDGTASAFNYLLTVRNGRIIPRNQPSSESLGAKALSREILR